MTYVFSMLSILELANTVTGAGQLKNRWHAQISKLEEMTGLQNEAKLDSALYAEHDGSTLIPNSNI